MDEMSGANSTVDSIEIDDQDAQSGTNWLQETASSAGEGMQELGSAGEVLTRLELDLAYSSEKLLNLDNILMHVGAKESDYEALSKENDEIWADYAEKGLEYVLLSGILDSEVRELESFMASLQTEISDARGKISSFEQRTEFFIKMDEKLKDLEKSFKQSQNLLSDMRMQSTKFQRTLLAFGEQENCNNKDAYFAENGQHSYVNTKLKMQTAEQQRHILRMLEKSLARELDMEKKLSDSRNSEQELKRKLSSAEHELFCMEEALDISSTRLFEAENSTVTLTGISKELMGRLQIVEFNLKSLAQREEQMRNKLVDSQTEASDLQKLKSSSSELDKSQARIHSLEEKLEASETQLQNSKASIEENQDHNSVMCAEITEMENVIHQLKENTSKLENKTQNLETKCNLLSETNMELNEELGFLKSSGNNIEKVNLLEKQLAETDIQIQHANASAEANLEKQNMLYSAIRDMENVIEDLKSKVSKAETRAVSAEVKCTMLSETNMELNDELTFLRGRTECLETSLHQGDEAKSATAKDITIRTKLITDLVLQLAMERERLQNQISLLVKANKILAEKVSVKQNDASNATGDVRSGKNREVSPVDIATVDATAKTSDEAETVSSTANNQVQSSVSTTEDAVIDTVRTIDPGQLNSKYYLLAIIIFSISVLAVYLLQHEKSPF